MTSPDQLFNVTAVQPEPIFAMAFNHEANGNISRAEWQTTFHRPQFYDYAYDPLNRLLSAQYGEVVPSYAVVGGAFQKFVYQINNNYNENSLTYDGDGNIKTLQRMGLSDANNCASKVQIDNLLYTLIPGTPRLQKVADSAPAANRAKGFNPGAASGSAVYVYDKNGNLTTDPYKGLGIQYNFLNLPKQITKGGSSITIRYDVTGRKWSQAGPEGIREYGGGVEYLDQEIQSVQHGEGRLIPTYSGTSIESIRAEYWRQDHLGNTRVAFSDFNLDGVIATKDDPNTTENDIEITQENHYYPFGLNQEGPWYQTFLPKNKHQHIGKEFIEDLGLNLNDFGARWYDPALGRWFVIDPIADQFHSFSPYNYVLNNPPSNIDLDGKDVIYLIDNSAPSGYGFTGHSALLIGNDQKGWTLYSKSGGNNPDGTAISIIQDFESLQDFHNNYASRGSFQYGFRVKTTEEQDVIMNETCQEDIKTTYSIENNCADLCRNVIESAEIEMGNRQTMLGFTYPLFEYQEFAANNPSGSHIHFTKKGSTPEDVSKGLKNRLKDNKENKSERRRNANLFIFSQILDKNGNVKVEEGTYKLDKDFNLIKQ